MSIEAVQARIADLTARIESFAQPGNDTSTQATTSTTASQAASALTALAGTSGTNTDFASVLSALTGTSGAASTPAASATTTGASLVAAAEKYIGVPYKWGGTDPATGLDCSGFVLKALSDIGAADGVPRTSQQQQVMNKGTVIPSLDQAQPGDLLFFHTPATHVAIYVGNGQMIDAPHTGSSVGIHPVWSGGPSTIRRLLPTDTSTAAPATSGGGVTSLSDVNSQAQIANLLSQMLATQSAASSTAKTGASL